MIGPTAARLITAWVVSALVFPVAYIGWGMYSRAFLEAAPSPPLTLLRSLLTLSNLRFFLTFFGGALVFQLLYGGVVYVILRRLGLFNLLMVLLAYLGPLAVIVWLGSDQKKDIIEAIKPLALLSILALVSWFLAQSPN